MEEKIKITQIDHADDDSIVDRYKDIDPWGMNVSIDIYGCDVEMIRNEKVIAEFIKKLIQFIGMKAYGEPLIKNFGPNPRLFGISALQLIETSSITLHFSPETKGGHIDIFSCRCFRPNAAGLFCKKYFKANELVVSPVTFRY
jgi:S-adenosylmethionine/arginine decarboxylase-like enzyme